MERIDLPEAFEALQNGNILVYPTDTLYALGADIYNESAVRKVFEIKKRPMDNPLPIAVSDIIGIKKVAFMNDVARELAEYFLPGPLTLILHKKNVISDIITSGFDNIAVRIPDNDVALELLSQYGPLTVTSANVHGEIVPDVISKIKTQFSSDEVAVYLDYGRLNGLPSTIVDVTTTDLKILREGIITKKEILDVI